MFRAVKRFILESGRPSNWRKASRDAKRRDGECQITGDRKKLEAHDITPFHLIDDPRSKSYTFWMGNLVTLSHYSHHKSGHCNDPKWKTYNPEIMKIVKFMKKIRKKCKVGL